MKVIGKLQDGTVFLKKGQDEGEELFEFKTDQGDIVVVFFLFYFFCYLMFYCTDLFDQQSKSLMGLTELC